MASLQDVTLYLVKHYPYTEDLSKTRLTKLVYLSDWESAVQRGRQITEIRWYFDHYGPYVPDVYETARRDRRLKVKPGITPYGSPKEFFVPVENRDTHETYKTLSTSDMEIMDRVIKVTAPMTFTRFIEYVYDTYPIRVTPRYHYLDLIDCARRYKENRE